MYAHDAAEVSPRPSFQVVSDSQEGRAAWGFYDARSLARGYRPFFFKQWGGKNKKKAGRLLDGRTWDEMPLIAS